MHSVNFYNKSEVIWQQAASLRTCYLRGTGSRMVSAMVPLDRALLSSYRLSIVTIPLSLTVWPQFAMQILTGDFDPETSLPESSCGIPRPLSNNRIIVTWVHTSVPAKWYLSPSTALEGCTSVTDMHTCRRTGGQTTIW